ncbi:hypothetical protein V3C99_007335, partial [Haemonchus contortus]
YMLPHRAFLSPLLWFLFLFQAHTALSCTFKLITPENFSPGSMNYNATVNSQSRGGCLEKCFEDFPECFVVGVEAMDSDYYCYIYNFQRSPDSSLTWTPDPSVILYKLERHEVDVECPLAVDVLK